MLGMNALPTEQLVQERLVGGERPFGIKCCQVLRTRLRIRPLPDAAIHVVNKQQYYGDGHSVCQAYARKFAPDASGKKSAQGLIDE